MTKIVMSLNRGKVRDITEVVTTDLRALLFWASVGVSKSRGGSYENQIEDIIESYAHHLRFALPRTHKFRKAPEARHAE